MPGAALLRRHGSFVGAVLALLSAKSAATAISLVLTPLIARLFVPADFGLFALIASIVAPLAVVATLRLDVALVVANTAAAARSLFIAALNWMVIYCAVIALLAGLVTQSAWGQRLEVVLELSGWIWLIPVLVALLGMTALGGSWLNRETRYGPLARSEVARAASTGGSRLAIGAATGSSFAGLAAGFVLGVIVQITLLWRHMPRGIIRESLLTTPWRERWRPIADYRDFPLYNASTNLLMAVCQSIPIMALGAIYGAAIVGAYAMAQRLVGGGASLVVMSIRRVYLQKIARIHSEGRTLRGAWTKATGAMLLLGIVPLAVLWIYGQEIIVLLLGPRWTDAGTYAEIMSILLLTQWLAVPSISSITVLRKQSWLLVAQVFVLLAQVVVLYLAVENSYDALTTIKALVAVHAAAGLCRLLIGAVIVLTSRPG